MYSSRHLSKELFLSSRVRACACVYLCVCWKEIRLVCEIDSVSNGKKAVSNQPFVNPSFPMPCLISHLSHACFGITKKKFLKVTFWAEADKQWHNFRLKWTLPVERTEMAFYKQMKVHFLCTQLRHPLCFHSTPCNVTSRVFNCSFWKHICVLLTCTTRTLHKGNLRTRVFCPAVTFLFCLLASLGELV